MAEVLGAFPQSRATEMTIEVWRRAFKPLRTDLVREAFMDYLTAPGPKRPFPLPADVIEFYDRRSRQVAEIERQRREDDYRGATRRLFHDPPTTETAKKAVAMIRDVWGGALKYGSTEWEIRFLSAFGPGYDPATGLER